MRTKTFRMQKEKAFVNKRLNQVKYTGLVDIDFIKDRLNYLSKNKPLSCPTGKCKCWWCGEGSTKRITHTPTILENNGYYDYKEDQEIENEKIKEYWRNEGDEEYPDESYQLFAA